MKKILIILLLLIANPGLADTNKTAVISIPKCGNFLLMKLMRMISKKRPKISSPYSPKLNWTQHFTIIHEFVQQQTITFCRANNVKIILIYRDPRDQIVSAAHYLIEKGFEKKLTVQELMTALITDCFKWWQAIGVPNTQGTIVDFFHLFLDWQQFDFVYATSFEKIIGPMGGGDQIVQLEEIRNIAEFCGYNLEEKEIEVIANELWGNENNATWGNSDTFRSGQIGAWQTEFTQEQKNLFKEVAGQLLIELGYEKDLNW